MAAIDPKSAKETYGKQKETNSLARSVSGTFIVVNKHLKYKSLPSGDRILCVMPTVLKVVEVDAADKEAAEALVMKPLWPGIEIWCTWDDHRSQMAVSHLALAHGFDQKFDPENDDHLAKAIANGAAYKLTIRVAKQKGDFTKIHVVEAKHVDPAKAKALTNDPSYPWKKDKVWLTDDKKPGTRRTEGPRPDDTGAYDEEPPF